MTPAQFRQLALNLPETFESAHMGHPDFRVRGKIFATLGPDETWAMVKLTPAQQALLINTDSGGYGPASGAWGERGATIVQLKRAKRSVVEAAIEEAWKNAAPKTLVREYEAS